jgi:flagellar basal body-associated protein FliL
MPPAHTTMPVCNSTTPAAAPEGLLTVVVGAVVVLLVVVGVAVFTRWVGREVSKSVDDEPLPAVCLMYMLSGPMRVTMDPVLITAPLEARDLHA